MDSSLDRAHKGSRGKTVRVVLASKNPGKVREFRQALALTNRIDLVTVPEDLVMPQETGVTFIENALLKARHIADTLHTVALADDSGLCVAALGGAPGVYSARYAGTHATDEQNCRKLLDVLQNVADDHRQARFTATLALVFPDGREITVTGHCDGYILREYRGDGGFGYDPLFYFPERKKSFAQMSISEKSQVSHRAQALRLIQPSFCLLE